MNTVSKLSGACIACAMLVGGTLSANADIGRDDVTAKPVDLGVNVALNPQPLPPRCLPPGCPKPGPGGAKVRSTTRRLS
jgi:hypothetical protein